MEHLTFTLQSLLDVHAGDSSRFCFLIKDRGQRPSLETVDKEQVEGLRDLVELMEKCWDHEPSKRPPFKGKSTGV